MALQMQPIDYEEARHAGFPASSRQYRNLIPALAERFHVIAPDYPGRGTVERASGSTNSPRSTTALASAS
jgi:pimeloyl-ACP methyl ester carboxylesterase